MTALEDNLEDRVARLEAEYHRIEQRFETLEELMAQLLRHLPRQALEKP
jgi:hypothetical protein